MVSKVILFDFDNTLANTTKLKEIREARKYDLLTEDILEPIKPYRPIPKLLEYLKSKGAILGIVSNSGRTYINIMLSHLKISAYFDTVVTYTDVKMEGMKPSPKGILLALENLNASPNQSILYVGDEFTDMVAAYRAGITPVLASWASKNPINTAPAIEMSSTMLAQYVQEPDEYKLFAERCAETNSSNFLRKACYFLPLDGSCNVITMRDEMSIFCLGRYFSQSSPSTALLHDTHALSQEIAKKEKVKDYSVPKYWHSMIGHVIKNAESYLNDEFDLISVIPAKKGKPKRLEEMLNGVQDYLKDKKTYEYNANLFYFIDDALSQKKLDRSERKLESDRSLHLTEDFIELIQNKRILIIDDVTTTGATFMRANTLLIEAGAKKVLGLVVAKTVSIIDDERLCPICGRVMWLRTNGQTHERFFSCSGRGDKINPCAHTESLIKRSCPQCGRPMRTKTRKKDNVLFWGCTGWNQDPACSYSESI